MSKYFSAVALIGDTINHELNMQTENNIVKNPNWWEANQLAIYKAWPWSGTWTWGLQITRPALLTTRPRRLPL